MSYLHLLPILRAAASLVQMPVVLWSEEIHILTEILNIVLKEILKFMLTEILSFSLIKIPELLWW